VAKGPQAFRTIGEVAADLNVEKHVLRFWETKFAQVKPMKRGGGRRYYRPEDIELLWGIRTLLYDEGYTIRGLQRMLRQHGVNYVKRYSPAAANADARGSSTPIPDLAGEAAGHARQAAIEQAKAPPKSRKTKSTTAARVAGEEKTAKKSEGAAAASRPVPLEPAQRRVLEDAVAELERCRELLAGGCAEY
jgi:DNA-binding transcriptional MerR regulator